MPFNFGSNTHARGTHQTHSHIPQNPKWFFPIRVLQGLIALVTLALSAFVIDVVGELYDFYDWHGTGMNIAASVLTFVFLIYIFLTASKFARAYNNWAVLALEILLVIFWLVTFALLADHAKEGNDLKKAYRGVRGRDKNAINSLTAAAVLSAINFLLFLVTCIFFALNLKKHRAAGYPMMAGTTATGGHKMQNINPATGTEQHYGANPADGAYGNSSVNNGQYGSSPVNNGQYGLQIANQPAVDQQYPPATYNQPLYNQQGHQAV